MKGILHHSGLAGIVHNLLRAGAAVLFMQHGVQKLFGWFREDRLSVFERMEGISLVQMTVAGVIETFGGLLLALGLFTRPIAALASLMMLWAYLQAHIGQGLVPVINQGELALLFMFVWAFMATHGPGSISLDHKMAAKHES